MPLFTICTILSLPFWIVYIVLRVIKAVICNSVLVATFFLAVTLVMIGAASIASDAANLFVPSPQDNNSLRNTPVIELDNAPSRQNEKQHKEVSTKTEEQQVDPTVTPKQIASLSEMNRSEVVQELNELAQELKTSESKHE